MIGVADTCFIIDWSKYSNREVLFKLFNKVLILKQVLDEVRREETLNYIVQKMMTEQIEFYEPSTLVLREADEIVRRSISIPHLRRVDLPEALCIAIGRGYGYVVLTENLGAYYFVKHEDRYKHVIIWRSIDVLREAYLKGFLHGDPLNIIEEYQRETKHVFSKREINRFIELVSRRKHERGTN